MAWDRGRPKEPNYLVSSFHAHLHDECAPAVTLEKKAPEPADQELPLDVLSTMTPEPPRCQPLHAQVGSQPLRCLEHHPVRAGQYR